MKLIIEAALDNQTQEIEVDPNYVLINVSGPSYFHIAKISSLSPTIADDEVRVYFPLRKITKKGDTIIVAKSQEELNELIDNH